MIMWRNSGIVTLLHGSDSNIRLKMQSISCVRGRIDLRNSASRRNASNVESAGDACFQGLREHVRLIKITPNDQTSFGPAAYAENGRGEGC